MKIETEIEIPHPHAVYSTEDQVIQPKQLLSLSCYRPRALMRPGTGGARPMSQCRTQPGEASGLKLLPVSLAWVSWHCQLPACEPDSSPSCAPHPSTKDGLITAFISTSTPLHHEPSTPSCCECTYDRYSADLPSYRTCSRNGLCSMSPPCTADSIA